MRLAAAALALLLLAPASPAGPSRRGRVLLPPAGPGLPAEVRARLEAARPLDGPEVAFGLLAPAAALDGDPTTYLLVQDGFWLGAHARGGLPLLSILGRPSLEEAGAVDPGNPRPLLIGIPRDAPPDPLDRRVFLRFRNRPAFPPVLPVRPARARAIVRPVTATAYLVLERVAPPRLPPGGGRGAVEVRLLLAVLATHPGGEVLGYLEPRSETLAPPTRAALDRLERERAEVRVLGFLAGDLGAPERDAIARLLHELAAASERLAFEPGDAELAAAYGIREPSVVFEVPGRRIRVPARELFTRPRLDARATLFGGEQRFASILHQLLDTPPPRLCVVGGAGGPDLATPGDAGLGLVAAALRHDGYVVEAPGAEQDCRALLLSGGGALAPEVEARLGAHLDARLPALVLLEPGTPTAPLNRLLLERGLELYRNTIIDPDAGFHHGSPTRPAPQINQHQITLPLLDHQAEVVLDGAAGIAYSEHAQRKADVRTLLQGSPTGWGERAPPGGLARLDDRDLQPPLSAAVAVSSRLGSNDGLGAPDPGEHRFVVIGDTDLATDRMIRAHPRNLDFLVRAVRWILREPDRVEIPPRHLGE